MSTDNPIKITTRQRLTKKLKNHRLSKNPKTMWFSLLAIFLVFSLLGGTYMLGHKAGVKEGKSIEAAKNKQNNPFSRGLTPFFKTVQGEVKAIEGSKITVENSKKEQHTIITNDKTKVTKKTETYKVSDIKVGNNLTAFLSQNTQDQDKKDEQLATRIVLRDKPKSD